LAELARIRRTIWDDALDSLVDQGLLLIDFSDPQRITDPALWPPDPCLAVDLPDKYDNSSREVAIVDLAQIVYEDGIVSTADQAKGFAQAILMTSYNIRDMYARLSLCFILPEATK
jgi:hypothetical protein